jgi:hypothetical protein
MQKRVLDHVKRPQNENYLNKLLIFYTLTYSIQQQY